MRASGARRKRGTSGTLVSQILRAPQRETENRGRPRASLHPDFGRHFAAGINCQVSAALRRARRDAIVNLQAPSHTAPRTATLHARAKLRPKALFLLHRARRVLFLAQPKREWGAHCPAGTPAESPGRLITAPTGRSPGFPELPGERQRKAAQDVSLTSPGWWFPQG